MLPSMLATLETLSIYVRGGGSIQKQRKILSTVVLGNGDGDGEVHGRHPLPVWPF